MVDKTKAKTTRALYTLFKRVTGQVEDGCLSSYYSRDAHVTLPSG